MSATYVAPGSHLARTRVQILHRMQIRRKFSTPASGRCPSPSSSARAVPPSISPEEKEMRPIASLLIRAPARELQQQYLSRTQKSQPNDRGFGTPRHAPTLHTKMRTYGQSVGAHRAIERKRPRVLLSVRSPCRRISPPRNDSCASSLSAHTRFVFGDVQRAGERERDRRGVGGGDGGSGTLLHLSDRANGTMVDKMIYSLFAFCALTHTPGLQSLSAGQRSAGTAAGSAR